MDYLYAGSSGLTCSKNQRLATMESLSKSPAVVATIVALLLCVAWKLFLEPSVLPDLPVAGLDRAQWFAWLRTYYRSFHRHRELYVEANQKVCLYWEFPNSIRVTNVHLKILSKISRTKNLES